jgi:soluble lytic murein transglycosylase
MKLSRTILTALPRWTLFCAAASLLGASLSLLFVPALAASPTAAENPRLDAALLDMAQAYKRRDSRALAAALPQFKGYVLEPWAAYWELSNRLDVAPKADIQAFLINYAGTYQEDRLRADWLLQLGRAGDWSTFNAQYPMYRMADDRSIQCYAALADFVTSRSDVAAIVQANWLVLREAEDGCASAYEALYKAHKLPAQVAWLRARLAMENDRPQVAAQAIAILDPAWVKGFDVVYQRPVKYLDDKLTAMRPKTRELVSLAMIRLADSDYQKAAVQIDKLRWRAQLSAEERSWVWGVIGKRAAQKLDPDALAYFAKGNPAQMHEDHLAWGTRAALRAGQWARAQAFINAMPATLRLDPTWTYWHARTQLELSPGASDPARVGALAVLQALAGTRGFYEMLALEETGGRITAPSRPAPLTAAEREAARSNPGLQRGLYAIQIGLRSEGVREWNYSTNLHQYGGMDDRALLAAAEMACRAEVWDRCINASDRTRNVVDVEQRFPTPFKQTVLARTANIGLDPAYVYGLIRQESRFIMDARSGVGASGLMQVMPATAKWTAKKLGMNDFAPYKINDRDTNIAIGTGYLKLALDSFNGSMPLAAAAYNAGPSRARLWRNGPSAVEGAIWAENVPFPETRDYVKKVLANTTLYAAILSGQPQSIKVRLGRIGPQSEAESALPDPGADLP